MGFGTATSASRREPVSPDINVTPLVDVVLVLLIIFMVIAPELEHGQRVELPAVEQADAKPHTKLDPIAVSVTAGGSVFVEKEAIADVAALRVKLAAIRAESPDRRVLLKADSALPYKMVRDVLAACQGAGLAGVGLAVTERAKRGG